MTDDKRMDTMLGQVEDAAITAYMDAHDEWSTSGIVALLVEAAERGVVDFARGCCWCADNGQYRPGESCIDLCDSFDGVLCDGCGIPSIEETPPDKYEAGYWTREAAHSRLEGDRPMAAHCLDLAADAYRRAVAA